MLESFRNVVNPAYYMDADADENTDNDDAGVAAYQVPDYVDDSQRGGKEAVVINYDELPAAFR